MRDPGASPRSYRTVRLLAWPLAFSIVIVVAFAVLPRPMRRSASGTSSTGHPVAGAKFVGAAECATCHQRESSGWRGSHHQLAMQPAIDATVSGDFRNVRFSNAGVTATFSRRDGKFMVRTDGPDGALHDYEIGFTFGVAPLQQYLIAMPGGRLQSLGIAWDSRPRERGGHRWLYLYPGQKISASDPLHWTGIDQNWNYMCADCHSTNVRKNYDPQTRTYATTYAEINVACEACHGPGSNHVAWARKQGDWKLAPDKGLMIALDERKSARWIVDPTTGIPHRSPMRVTQREIQMCARCHSRRGQIHEDYVHGQPVDDDYRVALLEPDLYFPDGQIRGEVYEYGSFIQSRMFHDGVTCSDCHEPHSLNLRGDGDNVCLQCHLGQKYDSPKHHFHKVGSAGARCVGCHMPTRLYMVVDARRDHSIRIPRPDLSMKLGTPNACNQCHVDKSARWASGAITTWYGNAPDGFQQFAEALLAGSEGAPAAPLALRTLVVNRSQPAIARGSALSLLASYDPAATSEAVRAGIADDSALVRRAGASAMSNSNPRQSAVAIGSLLTDPVRAVRIEAARALASAGADALPSGVVAALDRARDAYVAAQELNADRPEAHLDLALLFVRERKFERAETELKSALSLGRSFTPAAVNLADLYREVGRDGEGEAVLRQVLWRSPDDAAALHALGLWMVRDQQNQEALALLAAAARLDPANARYVYVYAIALNDAGQTRSAIATLEDNIKVHPYDRDSLAALVGLCDQTGRPADALTYARRFNELDPGNPQMLQMITKLNGQVGRPPDVGSDDGKTRRPSN